MRVHQVSFPSVVARPGAGRSYGFLSTFPPTACGLATFTAALSDGLLGRGAAVGIVRVADGTTPGTRSGASADEQDGYVPNVVYSCGVLVHADTLVIPYGIADSAIGIASVPLTDLTAAFTRDPA